MTAKTLRAPSWTTALVFVLILLPLAVTAVVKYLPALTNHQPISSLAVLHPHLIGPAQYLYLEEDVAKRLHNTLADVPGLLVRDVPATGSNLAQMANDSGASALLSPTLTVDAGIAQLNLQVIEAHTGRLIFNTPYQSSIDNYPNMMKAAGSALKRALF